MRKLKKKLTFIEHEKEYINKNITLKELMKNIDYRLIHLEDITADNREIMIKLVQQGNMIVEFLKQFDIEEIDPTELEIHKLPTLIDHSEERSNKIESLKELIDNFVERHEELKEFEDELKKYRNEITPGQVGES